MRIASISRAFTCLALLAACTFAGHAHAESLRCGNKLVLVGQTRLEVRIKCGEPSDVVQSTLVRSATFDSRLGYRGVIHSTEETIVIPVETWIYNLGPHRLMCRLRFVSGVLEAVETLGYGFDDDAAH
jgi:hypothetical protein